MTHQKIHDMYWEKNLSLSKIARQLNRSVAWVQKQFKKHGIKTRTVAQAGELRRKDLAGSMFGCLKVIGVTPGKPRMAKATCLCACGKICIVPVPNLRSGGIKSCGCAWRKSYEELPGKFLSQIRRQAKSRGLAFEITPKFMWELFISQNRLCALSGLPIAFGDNRTASLDRIDSSLGYTSSNVQWIHKDVNQMKMDLNQDYFLALVQKIAAHTGINCVQQPPFERTSAIGLPMPTPNLPGLVKPVVC